MMLAKPSPRLQAMADSSGIAAATTAASAGTATANSSISASAGSFMRRQAAGAGGGAGVAAAANGSSSDSPIRGGIDVSPEPNIANEKKRRARQLANADAIAALQLDPNERTKTQIDGIITWMQRQPEAQRRFLGTHDTASAPQLRFIARNIKLLKLHPGTLVYKQGDVGGDFYIIVRGSVELLHHPITSAATSTADTTFAATDGPGVAVSASLRKVLGARVGTLPAGECFGEHLTQSARGVVRTCSVVATGSEEEGDGSPTLVLQVSAAAFHTSVKPLFKKALEAHAARVQRLKALHLFRGWPDLELEFLSQYMEERVYQANDVVYYANSDVEAVFFVFAGTVALVEPATRHRPRYCVEVVSAPGFFGTTEVTRGKALTLHQADVVGSEPLIVGAVPAVVFHQLALSKPAEVCYDSAAYLRQLADVRERWHSTRASCADDIEPVSENVALQLQMLEPVQSRIVPCYCCNSVGHLTVECPDYSTTLAFDVHAALGRVLGTTAAGVGAGGAGAGTGAGIGGAALHLPRPVLRLNLPTNLNLFAETPRSTTPQSEASSPGSPAFVAARAVAASSFRQGKKPSAADRWAKPSPRGIQRTGSRLQQLRKAGRRPASPKKGGTNSPRRGSVPSFSRIDLERSSRSIPGGAGAGAGAGSGADGSPASSVGSARRNSLMAALRPKPSTPAREVEGEDWNRPTPRPLNRAQRVMADVVVEMKLVGRVVRRFKNLVRRARQHNPNRFKSSKSIVAVRKAQRAAEAAARARTAAAAAAKAKAAEAAINGDLSPRTDINRSGRFMYGASSRRGFLNSSRHISQAKFGSNSSVNSGSSRSSGFGSRRGSHFRSRSSIGASQRSINSTSSSTSGPRRHRRSSSTGDEFASRRFRRAVSIPESPTEGLFDGEDEEDKPGALAVDRGYSMRSGGTKAPLSLPAYGSSGRVAGFAPSMRQVSASANGLSRTPSGRDLRLTGSGPVPASATSASTRSRRRYSAGVGSRGAAAQARSRRSPSPGAAPPFMLVPGAGGGAGGASGGSSRNAGGRRGSAGGGTTPRSGLVTGNGGALDLVPGAVDRKALQPSPVDDVLVPPGGALAVPGGGSRRGTGMGSRRGGSGGKSNLALPKQFITPIHAARAHEKLGEENLAALTPQARAQKQFFQ